jgi:hypothetical protein
MVTEAGKAVKIIPNIVCPANEMCAFLWIEERLPELGLLDAFCEFLLQQLPEFTLGRSRARVQLKDVAAEASFQREHVASRLHVTGSAPSPAETG